MNCFFKPLHLESSYARGYDLKHITLIIYLYSPQKGPFFGPFFLAKNAENFAFICAKERK